MIVWNHGDNPIFIVTAYRKDENGGPGIPKETICIGPGNSIDLDIFWLRPEPPARGSRQKAVERLDAMAGRDEGGIMPPRNPMSIDRSPNSWWRSDAPGVELRIREP